MGKPYTETVKTVKRYIKNKPTTKPIPKQTKSNPIEREQR